MTTGVPSGTVLAIWSITSFRTRMQPFEILVPMVFVCPFPWIAIWPGPPLNVFSTSE